jgi:nucleoside-diphosphate-sugar epimerase
MSASSIAITGVSGNLGQRLVPMLHGKRILGLDMRAPAGEPPPSFQFQPMDLGKESSCDAMIRLFREHRVDSVVHLAFVLDPLRTGILDRKRMWQINVAGTARVMEAVAEINRLAPGTIKRVIALSSVSAYGPELPENVTEDHPLNAHTLTYAVHKKEMDEVVRRRTESMDGCEVVILRPHIFVGKSMQNYMAGSLKGDAYGHGRIGRRMQEKGDRLPMLLPAGDEYLQKRFQFVHVDDVARLIKHILSEDERPDLKIFNLAARGPAMTIAEAAQLGNARLIRIPTRMLTKMLVALAWKLGISSVPPDSFPYLCGTYTMDTTRLQRYLGPAYENVIRYTNESALRATFAGDADAATNS